MNFYRQLTHFVARGVELLDKQSTGEIKSFVSSQQNADGGFSDRGGVSDLYYSLFAHFILKSLHLTEYQKSLKNYILKKGKANNNHMVDLCCLAILHKDLFSRASGLKYLFAALKKVNRNSLDGSPEYHYFLLLLTLDAYGFNNTLTRGIVRRFYPQHIVARGLPCPVIAAEIILKKQLRYDVSKDCELLSTYFDDQHGFKVNPDIAGADLLSTAVALFALKSSEYSIILYAPSCLQFIEDNFSEGAFLPGNGDNHRDSEYTFYGILALGVLA